MTGHTDKTVAGEVQLEPVAWNDLVGEIRERGEEIVRLSATVEALKAERDAAFAMSKCECEPDEACANLAKLTAESDALRNEHYQLAYAITGGEDAPGLLNSVTVAQLVEIQRSNVRSHHESIDRVVTLKAENAALLSRVERLEKALKPFADEAERLGMLGLLTPDLILDAIGNVLSSDFIRARAALQEKSDAK